MPASFPGCLSPEKSGGRPPNGPAQTSERGSWNIIDDHVVTKESALTWWTEVLELAFTFRAKRRWMLKAYVRVARGFANEFFVISSIIGTCDVVGPQRQQFPLRVAIELPRLAADDVLVAEGGVGLAHFGDLLAGLCSRNIRAVQARKVAHAVYPLVHRLFLVWHRLQRAWHSWLHGHQLELLIAVLLASDYRNKECFSNSRIEYTYG